VFVVHVLRSKRWRLAIPPAAALIVAGSTLAAADSDVTRVTSSDPYAGCTIGAPGFNYHSAETEPYVAINPRDDDNLIGVFHQDRWDNGGAHGVASAYTTDGGESWKTVKLPFSTCAGGLHYQRASDTWVSFGPDGTAYVNAISFDQTTARSAVTAAVSTDRGRSWNHAQTVIADDNITIFNDKNSITADPVHAGVAYSTWDRVNVARNNQPAYFSKTTDGGKTWSTPTAITSNARNVGTIGNIIVVNRKTGALYDVFDNFTFFPDGSVQTADESVIKSTDGGASWSHPVKIAADEDIGVFHPVTGAYIRTGSGLPDVAIDPSTGQLYVVWEDARFSGGRYDEVALSTSSDGGATWSAPKRVNKPTGLPAFTPMVAVSQDGTVGVSYYDVRTFDFNTTDYRTLPTNYWLTTSRRGGAAFNREQAIIHTPFDLMGAPVAFGYFVGDYSGLDALGDDFYAFFGKTTGTESREADPDNRTDIFFRSLDARVSGDVVSGTNAAATPSFVRTAPGRAHERRSY
jgi:hypothetical protein